MGALKITNTILVVPCYDCSIMGPRSPDSKHNPLSSVVARLERIWGLGSALLLSGAQHMPISVEVGLLSGRTATVFASLDEKVEALKRRAQKALGVGRGRLLDASGSVLDGLDSIRKAGLQNGDSLTLHVNRVQICSADAAFAAILGDGSVVSWGDAGNGGDSSAVQDRLKNVLRIEASADAFAAILGDGSVVGVRLSLAVTAVQCNINFLTCSRSQHLPMPSLPFWVMDQ